MASHEGKNTLEQGTWMLFASKYDLRKLGVTLLALGLICAILCGLLLAWRCHFLSIAIARTATVTNIEASGSGESKNYRPFLSFTTLDGQTICEPAGLNEEGGSSFKVGDVVNVLYHPTRPRYFLIDSFIYKWFGPLIAGGFAFHLFLAGAVCLLIRLLGSHTRQRQLPQTAPEE